MAPRHISYRLLRRRMKRTLCYGQRDNMDQLSLPLSEFAVGYFNKHSPFDYLDTDFATNLSKRYQLYLNLDRLRLADKDNFESSDPADLYLAALMVASKYLHDDGEVEFVYNDEWAASAGRSLDNVNELEIKILTGIDWNLLVNASEFYGTLRRIEMSVCSKEMKKRGFGTYNEIQILSHLFSQSDFIWTSFFQPLITFLGLASLVYVTSVASMLALVHLGTMPIGCAPLSPENLVMDFHHSSVVPNMSGCPPPLSFVDLSLGPDTKLIEHTVASNREAGQNPTDYYNLPEVDLGLNSCNRSHLLLFAT